MAKVYNYTLNGKEQSVSVNDEIEKYLETNKNVTGEEPSEFISFYADAYKEDDIVDAIKKGIEDDSSILMMYQKYGNMAFEVGKKNDDENKIVPTENLQEEQKTTCKVTTETING